MNLMDLFIKIGVDDQASGKISQITGAVGRGLATAAKVGAAAVGAAAAGIAALTKASVAQYAQYEQLVGGVDTLFKGSSQKVQQYAADAYKTVGMSANQYMQNATAFSASLISSLGGDTEAAAEYANRAMVSMSDNANKMGTSLDTIVMSYQSLARGNFAMLDNLKLGYGGTKAELERLIRDAASYTDVQEEMGIAVDASSMSFDNIVNAIAVVQGHLGIAGASALEAGTTIEGSVNSMKAAWKNLTTGIAAENANIGKLIDDFVTTLVGDGTSSNLGVLGNIMPAFKRALSGVGTLVTELAPEIIDRLPEFVEEVLPPLLEAAWELVAAFGAGIINSLPELAGVGLQVAETIVSNLVTNFDAALSESSFGEAWEEIKKTAEDVSKKIGEAFDGLVKAVQPITDTIQSAKDAWDEYVRSGELAEDVTSALKTVIEGVSGIISSAVDNIASLVSWLTSGSDSASAFLTVVAGLTAALVAYKLAVKAVNLAQDIMAAKQIALAAAQKGVAVAQGLVNAVMNANPFVLVATLIAGVVAALVTLWTTNEGFREAVTEIWESIKETIVGVWDAISGAFVTAWEGIQAVWDMVAPYFQLLWDTISGIFSAVGSVLSGDFSAAWEAITGIFEGWGEYFSGLWEDVTEAFSGAWESFKEIGSDIVEGIKEGISGAWASFTGWFGGLWDGLVGGVKTFLGIKSPSRVFAGIGGNMALGVRVGWDDEFGGVKRDIEKSLDFEAATVRVGAGGMPGYAGTEDTGSRVSVVQNIYSQAKTAADLMQEALYQQERAVLMA